MSIVNTKEKTINTKIVYYGPGLGGKTTSLQQVHTVLDPDQEVKMVSLKTDEERTLFFDFLPIDLGMLGGYKIKIQGFTVPGQVKYNLTRKYVLMGADAVVFVADSQPDRIDENLLSLENLAENLIANGLKIEEIPLVMQYNKRDLPDATPIDELNARLSRPGMPVFETSAADGMGVFDAFVEASQAMIKSIARKYQLESPQGDVAAIAREALLSYVPAAR